MKSNNITIKERSLVARLAAKKMRASAVAIVFGNTIHLHNISKNELLSDERLLKHELCHVRQYQQHGFIVFIVKYLWESLRKGYYHNRFEVAAREAENQPITIS